MTDETEQPPEAEGQQSQDAGAAPEAWTPGMPLSLETRRFKMRSLLAKDVTDGVIDWLKDPDVIDGFNVPAQERTLEGFRRAVSAYRNVERFCLGIFDKDSDKIIGLYFIHGNLNNRSGASDVIIGDRDYWGKKVVVETRAKILDFLFDVLDVDKVNGHPFANNLPAIFNYKALGFQCEGVLRQQVLGHEGGRRDQCYFGLLKDEWQDWKSTHKEALS